jgi:hypothetical protein
LSGIEAVHRSQSFLDSLAEQMADGNHVAISGDKVRPGNSEGNGWPDPHPLAAKVEPEPYPLDALAERLGLVNQRLTGLWDDLNGSG